MSIIFFVDLLGETHLPSLVLNNSDKTLVCIDNLTLLLCVLHNVCICMTIGRHLLRQPWTGFVLNLLMNRATALKGRMNEGQPAIPTTALTLMLLVFVLFNP